MNRWTLLTAALTLMACGGISLPGGGNSICTSLINASFKISNEFAACYGQPQESSTDTSAAIAACSLEVTNCSAQDTATLTNTFNCLDNLPAFSCAWLDGGVNPDAGLMQWDAKAALCSPDAGLSSTCKYSYSGPSH